MLKQLLLLATITLAMACGGTGDVGESCDEAGVTEGVCVDGAICGKSGVNDGDLICLTTCADKDDCASDEDCNGVEGSSQKGCRLK